MTDIATAYVQLKPSFKGAKNEITSELGGSVASSTGSLFGSNFVGAFKKIMAGAAIGSMVSKALNAGGDLQQSFGGLETIYGDAADAAKEYALQATQAGISANEYAEQAVSFGASLKQAFGGDTVKAAEAANTAIMDMADNSAKMGTDITAVQSAYQGFAKQNYTMLDNLKLGYGGTKTEMERLLKDAEKLSGVKYDINNLGDVYSAIHVIQEDLGLTGVAAQEGAATFTGSMKAVKASLQNVLAGMALGQDIQPQLMQLGQNISNFINNNLLPMIGNILKSLPTMLSGLSGIIISTLRNMNVNSGDFIETAMNIVTGIGEALIMALPALIQAAGQLLIGLGQSFITHDWIGTMQQVASSLSNALYVSLTELGVPMTLQGAMQMIAGFIAGVAQRLPDILQSGVQLIGQFVAGLINSIPKVLQAIPRIIQSMSSAFQQYDWASIGTNILQGIARGIGGAVGVVVEAAKNAAKSAFDAAKNFLGISSPSKLFEKGVGRWIPAGIALGIEKNLDYVESAMQDVADLSTASYSNAIGSQRLGINNMDSSLNGGYTQNITINSPRELSPSEIARQTRNATQQMALTISGVI